jgi:hypothetical protein
MRFEAIVENFFEKMVVESGKMCENDILLKT